MASAKNSSKERVVVSGSDLEVLRPPPRRRARTAAKSLGEAVRTVYAAEAPQRARFRPSIAHAIDATYGNTDPEAIVKTVRPLIDAVYAAADQSARP
jgi:hypothetical protein